jgi:hypothetical protein
MTAYRAGHLELQLPPDLLGIYEWLLMARPFVEAGKAQFFPRMNWHWRDTPYEFPQMEECDLRTTEGARKHALQALFREHEVSRQMGCLHLDPASANLPLLVSGATGVRADSRANPAYLTLNLSLPFVANTTYAELWSILRDESDSINAFRRGIRAALDEIAKRACTSDELKRASRRLQRDFIDEPFEALRNKLRRLESIRRAKYAAYAVATGSAALFAANGQTEIATGALGGVSAMKLMESYLSDAERTVGLKEDARYWLTRIVDHA